MFTGVHTVLSLGVFVFFYFKKIKMNNKYIIFKIIVKYKIIKN